MRMTLPKGFSVHTHSFSASLQIKKTLLLEMTKQMDSKSKVAVMASYHKPPLTKIDLPDGGSTLMWPSVTIPSPRIKSSKTMTVKKPLYVTYTVKLTTPHPVRLKGETLVNILSGADFTVGTDTCAIEFDDVQVGR